MEINKIYNEDCLITLSTLKDNSIDLIVADPPYYKVIKNEWDSQWNTEEEFYKWCGKWIKECYRVLKENGSLYIWNWFDNICELGHIAKKNGFMIRNLIAWNRGGGREDNNYRSQKEDLLYLVKGNKPTFNINDILIPSDDPSRRMTKQAWERGKYERKGRPNYNEEPSKPSNVWYDSFIANNSKEKVNHPTQKPLSVCNRIVRASSNEGDVVYIPFAGSGSEIVSCINNNRNWIASEISEEYVNEVIIPRINSLE